MRVFFFWSRSVAEICSSTSARGVVEAGTTSSVASITCQPNWVFTGSESSPVSSSNATLSNGGTVAPFCAVVPLGRGLVGGELAREPGEVGAVLELPVDLVGLRLRLDEDVPDLARGRLLELRLVLVVVGLNVLVGDLDLARDLLEDLLGEQPGAEVVSTCSSVWPVFLSSAW